MILKKKEQTLPKWFKGMIYKEGAEVTNPFSGESYELTGVELSLYDFIMGCQMMFESTAGKGLMNDKRVKEYSLKKKYPSSIFMVRMIW